MSEEEKVEKTETTETTENVKKAEETKATSKSWFNRVWAAILGVIIGVAGMFGVDQVQISGLKEQLKQATEVVQNAKKALDEKDILTAIGEVKKGIDILQAITGEVKEVTAVVKTTGEEYKADVVALKTAIDAKDYKTATAAANSILKKITDTIPADKLTGNVKKIYDLVIDVNKDIEGGKYDAVVERVKQLMAIFEKKEETPVAPAAEAAN